MIDKVKMYMNPATGFTDTYDDWWYVNINNETVNAVDLEEVVEVKMMDEEWIEV